MKNVLNVLEEHLLNCENVNVKVTSNLRVRFAQVVNEIDDGPEKAEDQQFFLRNPNAPVLIEEHGHQRAQNRIPKV